MNNEEIIKSLQEQLGQPIINRKKVEESKLHILDNIIAGELPVYRKWLSYDKTLKYMFRIDVVEGRLQVDRIKFENFGRIEFDTGNHSIVLDSEYKPATNEEWLNCVHKLMKYIRNGI